MSYDSQREPATAVCCFHLFTARGLIPLVGEHSSPFFSVVIPTRNRAYLARMSAAHVLAQDFGNLELIILQNSDDRDLSTAEFTDVRCRVDSAATVLSMRDNWERALDIVKGQFVMFLSDKDMLLPGALRRIASAIKKANADMLNYRKAAFNLEGPFQSFVQRCSGQLVEKDGHAVLRAWFGDVAHFHDAPMIYNSAVRRDVLMELRVPNGTFFQGASPDIGSGMVLMARLKRYHVLDRPLAVSWFGKWSIGMSTLKGTQGAATAFRSEYQRDPFRNAGLVSVMSGAVAEAALAYKACFPSLFKPYRVNWSTYVRNVLVEFQNREEAGLDMSAEREFFGRARKDKYSWLTKRIGEIRFQWKNVALSARLRARLERMWRWPIKNSQTAWMELPTSNSDASKRDLDRYFSTPLSDLADFRDVPCVSLPWAGNVSEVESFAANVNDRLDELEASDKNQREAVLAFG